MDIRKIADEVFVTGQIQPGDMAGIAAQGIKGVICNRPDNESADQPSFAEVEAAAKAEGLEIRYIPIIPGQAGANEVTAFRAALDELPMPILAYCRSGARSTAMYDAAKS